MSSKSKKMTPVSSKSYSSISMVSSGSSNRPASPTFISRLEEKSQLASLNDRLAAYIERVRTLEFENDRLVKVIQSYEESSGSESSKIKSMYDSEIADARKLLDQMGKEKAKVQLEVNKLRSDLDDLLAKLNGKERALGDAEKRILSLESQLNGAQARLADSSAHRRQLEEELMRLKQEMEHQSGQLLVAKQQLEDETLKRVDLENRIQSLKEQLKFQQDLHEQELSQTATSKRGYELEVIEMEHKRDLENQMSLALHQMRQENEDYIASNRAEIETVFQKKMNDLQEATGHWEGEARKGLIEINQLKSKVQSLTGELDKLNNKHDSNAQRVEFLEKMLQKEKDEHSSDVATRDAEIRRLKLQLEEQLQEYKDLFDLKIQLDVEISAYRKLLDIEENRLNTTPKFTVVSPGSSRKSFESATTSARKRKLAQEGNLSFGEGAGGLGMSDSYMDFSSTGGSSGKSGLGIVEVDGEGKFVRLQNYSDKEISLSGWILNQKGDGGQEVNHKFSRSSTVKPLLTITIWSHEKSGNHGVNDIVMKNQNWLKTDNRKTTLQDNYGEEVAWKETKKSFSSSYNEGGPYTRIGTLTRKAASSMLTGFF